MRKKIIEKPLPDLDLVDYLGVTTALVRLMRFEKGSQGSLAHITDTLMDVHRVKLYAPTPTGMCTANELKLIIVDVVHICGYWFVLSHREEDKPAFSVNLPSDHPVVNLYHKVAPVHNVLVKYEDNLYLVPHDLAVATCRALTSSAKRVSSIQIKGG